jgi:hypothetical protein
MAEHVQAGAEAYGPDGDGPAEAASRHGLGAVLAAILAMAASGGLAWWFVAAGGPSDVSAAPPPAPPQVEPAQPVRYAASDPDPNAVRRAWTDVRQAYADSGPEALVRGSEACARAVPADPQRLDYCLAFDIYASAVAPQSAAGQPADWFSSSGDRGLALARMALPEGVDAHNRIAQVAALTRAVLPKAAPGKPATRQVRAVRHPPAKLRALKVRRTHGPVAARPKLLKAALRRPSAVRRPAPLATGPAPALVPEGVRRQTLDDYLRGSQPDELLDPPH